MPVQTHRTFKKGVMDVGKLKVAVVGGGELTGPVTHRTRD
jgi:hypothetical protein